MIPTKPTTVDLDAEIDSIVSMQREIDTIEEFENSLRDLIHEKMEMEGRLEYESIDLGLKVRRFQVLSGEVFHHPNFVMNRSKVQDARGRMVDLIPYRLMTTLVKFDSKAIKNIVSDCNLSEDDTALFVADHTVRKEHLRFY